MGALFSFTLPPLLLAEWRHARKVLLYKTIDLFAIKNSLLTKQNNNLAPGKLIPSNQLKQGNSKIAE
jgi:hypothetical protein